MKSYKKCIYVYDKVKYGSSSEIVHQQAVKQCYLEGELQWLFDIFYTVFSDIWKHFLLILSIVSAVIKLYWARLII